jgi:hypothetical protein
MKTVNLKYIPDHFKGQYKMQDKTRKHSLWLRILHSRMDKYAKQLQQTNTRTKNDASL